MSELHSKLLKAQAAMPKLRKDGENPHFRSKFISLDNLLDHVLPVLNDNGLVMYQSVTSVNGDPALNTVVTDGKDEISSTMLLMMKAPDPQGQGSAITYARRYSLMALLGLSAGEDDDGNAANESENIRQEQARQQTAPRALEEISEILDNKGITDSQDKKMIVRKLTEGKALNTSGIARLKKEIILAMPDTLKEMTSHE